MTTPKEKRPIFLIVTTLVSIALNVGQLSYAYLEYNSGNAAKGNIFYVINNNLEKGQAPVDQTSTVPGTPDPSQSSVVNSSGPLTATQKNPIVFKTASIEPHLALKNTSNYPVYVTVWTASPESKGTFDSHASSGDPLTTGISYCNSNAQTCMGNLNISELSKIDPGKEVDFQLVFTVSNEVSTNDVFSYSLIVIARVGKSNQPDDVEAPTTIPFRFNNNRVQRS
jgi:hypothetical protein